MTTNTKSPTVTEAGAVELTETELDQASGGWSFGQNNSYGQALKAATQKVADGSVKPFMAGGLGGDGTGI